MSSLSKRLVTTSYRKNSILIHAEHCGPVFLKLAFIARLKATSVKPYEDGAEPSEVKAGLKASTSCSCFVSHAISRFGSSP